MKLSVEQVRHVAALAALSLTEAEEQAFVGQLQQVLDAFEALRAIDTSQVALAAPTEPTALRPDVALPTLGVERALANAPASEAGSFAVPKVIE